MEIKNEYFECECYSSEHLLRFTFIDDTELPELYASVYLDSTTGFFARVKKSIKYIFGYKSQYGQYGEYLLRVQDVDRFIELLEQYKKSCQNSKYKGVQNVST